MENLYIQRIWWSVLIFISIMLLPWYFLVPVMMVPVFLYKKYYEVFFWSAFIDFSFGSTAEKVFSVLGKYEVNITLYFSYSLFFLFFFVLMESIRPRIMQHRFL